MGSSRLALISVGVRDVASIAPQKGALEYCAYIARNLAENMEIANIPSRIAQIYGSFFHVCPSGSHRPQDVEIAAE
jgi:hypothetical protein